VSESHQEGKLGVFALRKKGVLGGKKMRGVFFRRAQILETQQHKGKEKERGKGDHCWLIWKNRV